MMVSGQRGAWALGLGVLTLCVVAALGRPHEETVCGYESCPKPKPGVLNIHLVAHTHDDVGWLKTVDQYYYGGLSMTQKAGVQYILDSVVDELLQDHTKRFIYVETAFFWKWWKEQHDSRRHQVKHLIKSGRLEMIGGAWSMNDEAVTNYMSIIDQFTWGFRKLNDTFGQCARPRVGWQIDPFGHSREMASLFAQMGFDGLFLGRIDYQDKANRLRQRKTEMVWEASSSLGRSANLFTGVLYNTYSPPPGFCFDVLCSDDPIVDDKHSPEYNIEVKATDFVNYAREQGSLYTSGNVILTMGGDFTYQAARFWYQNMDRLIRYINAHQEKFNANIFYSTPSCYLKAVHDTNNTWSTKSDDFFPYASDPNSYWTGYYTSRPTIKFFERQGNNFLQVCKQLYALADLGPEDKADLDALREAMGVMQHHDAITGTEKQHVADDYSRQLNLGMEECSFASEAALNKMITKNNIVAGDVSSSSSSSSSSNDSDDVLTGSAAQKEDDNDENTIPFKSCLQTNQSACEVSEKYDKFVVTVYNPLSQKASQYVRIPVPSDSYTVRCPMGHVEKSDIMPIPESVEKMPGRIMSSARYELVFKADHLPPLGFRSFFVSKGGARRAVASSPLEGDDITLGNDKVLVQLDRDTNLVKGVSVEGSQMALNQTFLYYEGMTGNNEEFRNRSSGAYIFRPVTSDAKSVAVKAQAKVFKGQLVHEVHQTFNDWTSQVIRAYAGESHVEFEWMVGPIPVDDKVGKEVVSRFTTDLNNKGVFFTDSNGREMLRRQRDFRPTWKLSLVEPVAGNYYPITSKIKIRDETHKQSIAVLVDRAQGGASLNDGEIELMVHRRLLHDDAFGVGEALNEEAFGTGLVARGKHYLIGGTDSGQVGRSLAAQERILAQKKLLAPWTFFTPIKTDMTFEKWQEKYNMEFSGLTTGLPHNVHILTLEPWKGKSFLLRLEHFLEKGEDHELSKPVSVDLQTILTPFKILRIQETTLGANQWLSESNRLQWQVESNEVGSGDRTTQALESESDFTVELTPMQIRTFIIDVNN